jgi:hypothetical protein
MSFSTLSLPRLQASLAGQVLDAQTKKSVEGVEVRITGMPPAFQKTLGTLALMHGAAWSAMRERADLTYTQPGGVFRFINLPDGAYTLGVSMPNAARLYGMATVSVTVSRDAAGNVTTAFTPIDLPPTAIKGKVLQYLPPASGKPGSTAPLWMAEVRARGSAECAYSTSTGDFYLHNVEPGPRTLLVNAPGLQAGSLAVTVQAGVIAAPAALVLYP